MDIEVQKEVAQGLYYMKNLLGEKSLPTECNATEPNDYGRTRIRTGKVNLWKELSIDNAFSTVCHECVHVYDGKRGLISERVINSAAANLGMSKKDNKYARAILDILGIDLYSEYKDDPMEIMAYAIEENLYGTQNNLAQEIYGELMKQ